jgi:acyl-CoA reductase-like NAD-dependent aldehyde dehydrogenase
MAGALMLVSLTGQAQEPTHQMMMSNMHTQLANFGGSMHTTAKVCGDYSDEKLAEQKEKQRTLSIQGGMDAATFDEAFDAGASEAKAKWASIPASERQTKCDEFKQEMEGLAQQFMQ